MVPRFELGVSKDCNRHIVEARNWQFMSVFVPYNPGLVSNRELRHVGG
jgi:hypothetical protein